MATIAQLAVIISANLTQLERDLSRAQSMLTRTGKSVSAMGSSLTKSLTVPLVMAGGAAVKMFTDFESGMANVGTLLGKTGAARTKELGDDVKRLAKSTGKNLDDLSGGLYQVISAFGDSAESAELLEIAVTAGAAGLSTTLEAVNLLSAVTKGYGDTSAKTQRYVSDLAFQTVKLGQTTFPELAASIGRVTPLAATLGVSVEELFGGFATLTGVTGNAAEVSTQMAAIMRAMMKPTQQMSDAIAKLGYKTSQAMLTELGMTGSLRALMTTTNGTQEAVGELFGRAEALTAVFALTGSQAEVFDAKLAAMYESAGMTAEAFAIQQATVSATLDRAKQEFVVVLVGLGEQIIPLVKDVLIPAFKSLGESVGRLLQWYKDLSPAQKQMANGFLMFLVAVGPVLSVVGKLLTLGGGLIGMFRWIGAKAIPFLAEAIFFLTTNPLGLVVTTIGLVIAAGVLLWKNWDKIAAVGKRVWNGIADTIKGAINIVIGLINGFIGLVNRIPGVNIPLIGKLRLSDERQSVIDAAESSEEKQGAISAARGTSSGGVGTGRAAVAGIFHRGGIVPGPYGREVPILATAGETIRTPNQERALNTRREQVMVHRGEITVRGVTDRGQLVAVVELLAAEMRADGDRYANTMSERRLFR